MSHKLNAKTRAFVEAYAGDVVEAMQIAGYTGAPNYLKKKGETLLKQPLIIEAIKHRSRYTANVKRAIATREDRQEFWTNIMKNSDPDAEPETLDKHGNPLPEPKKPNIPIQARLKASELLGKSEADFVDRLDIDANVSLTEIVMNSYKPPVDDSMSLEDIEAEYYRVKKAAQDEEDEEQAQLEYDGEDEEQAQLEYGGEDEEEETEETEETETYSFI